MPTRSRIDLPFHEQWFDLPTAANGIQIKGVAFGGDKGVSRVEVSADDGGNWAEARLDYPGTRLTWALWSFDWKPVAGDLHARRPRHECRWPVADVRREAPLQIRYERFP
ncbi:MAG: hypothetical protein M3Q89_04760 [Verrucomicrobiota bacterium]|nr:hypothetical protein [Verrucomicrobiota bacterium]